MRGEKISRPSDGSSEGPHDSAVPAAGQRESSKREEPDPDTGGMEPQPS